MTFFKHTVQFFPQIVPADRQLRQRMLAYLKPHWRVIGLGIICSIGVSLAALGVAFLLKLALKAILHRHEGLLSIVCFGLLGLYAVRWPLVYGQTVLFSEAGQRI